MACRHRPELACDTSAAELGASGFVHDNADLDAAPRLLADVADALGAPVEILVTNTGGPPPSPDPLGPGRDAWEAAYRTLFLAPLALVDAAVPSMRERRFGRVVKVATAGVREPMAGLVLSTTHRAAALSGFKTLARHLAPDGITLNSLLPGRIATQRSLEISGSRQAAEEQARETVPAQRLGTVEEVAAAAAFLCSARASYVTGTALLVDGGATHSV